MSLTRRSGVLQGIAVLLAMIALPAPRVVAAEASSASAPSPRISPVRRTTIATADPEASLRFYRDLLGFSVEYDREVREPGQLTAFAPRAERGRAIALRQGARLGGSIGLLHVAGMTPPRDCRLDAPSGAVAILLLTDDLEALRRRLQAARVRFVNEPHRYDQGRGPTDTFTVFDPNCVRVAFAQIQRESFEQSVAR